MNANLKCDNKSDVDIQLSDFPDSSHLGNGIECHVYDVGDGIIYKEYIDKSMATLSYNLALTADLFGVGPAVYAKTQNGYFTEKVYVIEDNAGDEAGLAELSDVMDSGDYYCDYADDFKDTLSDIFGGKCSDMHCGNVGINNMGRLVCIDFGIYSFRNTIMCQIIARTCFSEADFRYHFINENYGDFVAETDPPALFANKREKTKKLWDVHPDCNCLKCDKIKMKKARKLMSDKVHGRYGKFDSKGLLNNAGR